MFPAQINRRALNKACVTRWKKAIFGCLSPMAIIITPSCLKVDRAMIFFKSVSHVADILAIKQVITPMIRILFWK